MYRVLLLTTTVKVPSTDVITPNFPTPKYENDKRNGESNLFFSVNDRVYSRRDSPTAGIPVKQVTRGNLHPSTPIVATSIRPKGTSSQI